MKYILIPMLIFFTSIFTCFLQAAQYNRFDNMREICRIKNNGRNYNSYDMDQIIACVKKDKLLVILSTLTFREGTIFE